MEKVNRELLDMINGCAGINPGETCKQLVKWIEQRKWAAIDYQQTRNPDYLPMIDHCNNQIKLLLGL